jgi:thioredoxin-related protein
VKLVLSLLMALALPALAADWESFFDPFLGDLRAELDEAKRSGRKGAMVMYHFDACPYCARVKAEVLSRPEVRQRVGKDFLLLAIDTRGAQPITGLDGKVLPENEHARQARVRATPTFDFYAPDGERLYRHVGGIFDPAEFVLLGRFVASGAHRSSTFTEYKQKSKGS